MIIAAPVDWECVKSGNANAIVFEYVDEKVSKVYAQRNRSSNGRISSYIEFNYDTKGLLTTMKAQAAANSSVETLKTIGYEYNSCGDLLAVTKKVGNNQKEISRFEYYPYSLLKSIVETDTNSATRLSYNTNYKADKISFGYVTDVKNMATFVEKSYHKFFYKIYFSDNQTYPQETMVENEKDILLSYNFNRSGEITAAFEKAYPQAEILTTLTKKQASYWEDLRRIILVRK